MNPTKNDDLPPAYGFNPPPSGPPPLPVYNQQPHFNQPPQFSPPPFSPPPYEPQTCSLPPAPTQVFVVTQPELVTPICGNCGTPIGFAHYERQASAATHLTACIMCFICFPCCFIPYCLETCYETKRTCSGCNAPV